MAPTGSIGSSNGREEGFYSGSYGYSEIPEPIATPVPDFIQLRSYEEATDVAPAMVPAVPCPAPIRNPVEIEESEGSNTSIFDFDPVGYVSRKVYGLGEVLESWGLGAEPGRPKEVAVPAATSEDEYSSTNLMLDTVGVTSTSQDGHVKADMEKARRVIKNNLAGETPQRLPSKPSGRGAISGALETLGTVVDVATGAAGVIVEYKRDIDRCDNRRTNLQKEIIISTAQTASSVAGGAAAAAATSALFATAAGFTAPFWIPAAVGVAAAAGTGWLLSQGFDYIRREWKD